jgi:flagellar basal-body rod protein FlgB
MVFKIDSMFGIHEEAMHLRSKRAEVLASNMANADTPNYKARDIDFRDVLAGYQKPKGAGRMDLTRQGHLNPAGFAGSYELLYRVPTNPEIDGNTVDVNKEKAEFAENSLRYNASVEFMNSRVRGMISAIKGE